MTIPTPTRPDPGATEADPDRRLLDAPNLLLAGLAVTLILTLLAVALMMGA